MYCLKSTVSNLGEAYKAVVVLQLLRFASQTRAGDPGEVDKAVVVEHGFGRAAMAPRLLRIRVRGYVCPISGFSSRKCEVEAGVGTITREAFVAPEACCEHSMDPVTMPNHPKLYFPVPVCPVHACPCSVIRLWRRGAWSLGGVSAQTVRTSWLYDTALADGRLVLLEAA
jgi:hypothetical protein